MIIERYNPQIDMFEPIEADVVTSCSLPNLPTFQHVPNLFYNSPMYDIFPTQLSALSRASKTYPNLKLVGVFCPPSKLEQITSYANSLGIIAVQYVIFAPDEVDDNSNWKKKFAQKSIKNGAQALMVDSDCNSIVEKFPNTQFYRQN